MLESKIISVDPGKFATKAVALDINDNMNRSYFRSKIFRLDQYSDMDVQGESFKVNFDGADYIIGEQGEEIDYNVDKASIIHKLGTYVAISQLLEGYKSTRLVLGCPTTIWRNRKLREDYKSYILNDNTVNIKINNEPFTFVIDNILILPEGSGIVYLAPDLFKGRRVAVIDLGGLNMNFAVYNNLIPEPSSMFTKNLGYVDIETSIINNFSINYGTDFGTNDVQDILRQKGLKIKGTMDTKSVTILNTILQQYILRVIQEIKKNNFELNNMDVVFIGGTSLMIEDVIKKHIPHATIIDDAQWANVEGFYKVGAIKYAGQ